MCEKGLLIWEYAEYEFPKKSFSNSIDVCVEMAVIVSKIAEITKAQLGYLMRLLNNNDLQNRTLIFVQIEQKLK